jgi:hypothetical protein
MIIFENRRIGPFLNDRIFYSLFDDVDDATNFAKINSVGALVLPPARYLYLGNRS